MNRTFDILVDGQCIATETLKAPKPGDLVQIEYAIPPELTRGKDRVTIMFRSRDNSMAGGVFDMSTIRGL